MKRWQIRQKILLLMIFPNIFLCDTNIKIFIQYEKNRVCPPPIKGRPMLKNINTIIQYVWDPKAGSPYPKERILFSSKWWLLDFSLFVVCFWIFFHRLWSYWTICIRISKEASPEMIFKVLLPLLSKKRDKSAAKCQFMPFYAAKQPFLALLASKCYQAKIMR